ncbi:hypothetical protein NGM37_54215 [Streptomyces sp. TRM76130]|nr:hypothetical protein [Streptomyces sp. TRM76130]
MDGDPSWWVVFVVAVGVTVVYGAVFLSLVAAVLLGVAWGGEGGGDDADLPSAVSAGERVLQKLG